MPSSREIKNQNDGLNEQRDILEEISSLMEDASKASEDLTKSLSGVADLFGQIRDDSKEIPDNIDDTNTSTNKFNTLLKQAQGKTKDLAKGLVSAGKQVANTMTSALGEIGDILSNVVSLSVVGTFGAIFGAVVSKFQADFKSVVNELGYGFAAANGELSNLNKTFEGMASTGQFLIFSIAFTALLPKITVLLSVSPWVPITTNSMSCFSTVFFITSKNEPNSLIY